MFLYIIYKCVYSYNYYKNTLHIDLQVVHEA